MSNPLESMNRRTFISTTVGAAAALSGCATTAGSEAHAVDATDAADRLAATSATTPTPLAEDCPTTLPSPRYNSSIPAHTFDIKQWVPDGDAPGTNDSLYQSINLMAYLTRNMTYAMLYDVPATHTTNPGRGMPILTLLPHLHYRVVICTHRSRFFTAVQQTNIGNLIIRLSDFLSNTAGLNPLTLRELFLDPKVTGTHRGTVASYFQCMQTHHPLLCFPFAEYRAESEVEVDELVRRFGETDVLGLYAHTHVEIGDVDIAGNPIMTPAIRNLDRVRRLPCPPAFAEFGERVLSTPEFQIHTMINQMSSGGDRPSANNYKCVGGACDAYPGCFCSTVQSGGCSAASWCF